MKEHHPVTVVLINANNFMLFYRAGGEGFGGGSTEGPYHQ